MTEFYGSVADSYYFDADPGFHFRADPNPTFYFDPDLAFMRSGSASEWCESAISDLQTLHGFTKVCLYGSTVSLYASTVSFHSSPGFHFDADPAVHFDVDPDPASHMMRMWIATFVLEI